MFSTCDERLSTNSSLHLKKEAYSFAVRGELYAGTIRAMDDGNTFKGERIDFGRLIDERLGLEVVHELVDFLKKP